MFIHRNEEMLFFIEEPELNLHPGLQRKLIEAMLSDEFSNHQFFLTTHSNHLLDLTLDYSFVEYSGANLIHWNFDDADNLEEINAKYLSRHIFLVADNDFPNNNSKKKKNQEILEGILKDNYYKLPVREIENLLSVSVLKKVIIDREKAIERGISLLEENDILLVLGKGHEEFIIMKDKKIPFNDKKCIKKIINKVLV